MASLTDWTIRQAIEQVGLTGKQKTLAEGESRSIGPLMLAASPSYHFSTSTVGS